VYTKNEEHVGVVEDISTEENLIIRGSLDLRKYFVPRKFIISFYNGKVVLDMTRDDFIQYGIE
jgi:hypothetical protein